jgi:hypothetical protein
MATVNSIVQTLNGMFKETYADKLVDLRPDGVYILNTIKFLSKDKQPGNLYHQPVILGMEHGVTFAASDDDAFNLNPPIAGQIKDATIKGNPVLLRSVMGYTAASRAAQGGSQAFMDATKYLVASMLRSVSKKMEIAMLYGQVGYGVVAAGSGGTTIVIDSKEFAPGIWAGAENLPIEVRNTTGTIIRGSAKVLGIDLDTKTLTLDSSIPGMVVGDVIWHKGAYGNEFAGIHKILSQNTGTLFGIDVTQFNLFKGNVYDAGNAQLSFAKISNAISKAVAKGLDSKVSVLVNPDTWSNLLTDQAALRRYDGSYSNKELNQGAKSIKFHSQNGEIEIIPSIYVKAGYAYILCIDEWARVGSSDLSFKRPGMGDEYFRDLENSAGYELRLFTDQALFCYAPGKNVLIKNIVNSV